MRLFAKKKTETRADAGGAVSFEEALLRAILEGDAVTRQIAMQVPTVSGGIDIISSVIASTPIKLFRDINGKSEPVEDDQRVKILNDNTGDTLSPSEMWRALVHDYYLGKGGYAYIEKTRGKISGLYYVQEEFVNIVKNSDPIHKEYDIMVNGQTYKPYDFLRILRNSRDGAQGVPLTVESSQLIAVAFNSLRCELALVKKGGNKKGFLESEHKLDEASMEALRSAFRNLYCNDDENAIVLNNGVKFHESSNTSVEMQLNENKVTNALEFAKIFHVSPAVMAGTANQDEVANLAKLAAIPLMCVIQNALNSSFLLEKEKREYYWAFDTRELLKGTTKERYEAYKTALDGNFMQIDEVRYAEDMPPLGLTWIKLGLNDVLYDPVTKEVYTPNTDKTTKIGYGDIREPPAATDDKKEILTEGTNES